MTNFDPSYLSNFNLQTTHPLINNANEYTEINKFVSIHSEDRNIIQYPSSSYFEITLPQSLENIIAVKVSDYAFPSNYNAFSIDLRNLTMTFKITETFQPDPLDPDFVNLTIVYNLLNNNLDHEYILSIEEGYYTPNDMITELTNKMNDAVSTKLFDNFAPYNQPPSSIVAPGGIEFDYRRFKVNYNRVQQNIWFGNNADRFTLTNSNTLLSSFLETNLSCNNTRRTEDFSQWGLPDYIGLPRTDSKSINQTIIKNGDLELSIIFRPFFSYEPKGTAKYNWLTPNPSILTNDRVWWVESPYKINLMGPSYFYIDIPEFNFIDELYPYSLNKYTQTNSNNSGNVNSSIAKIPITSVPLTQSFGVNAGFSYKYFNPPAERISKLKIGVRYHNGVRPDFSNFPWSMTLQFILLEPSLLRQGVQVSRGLINTNLVNITDLPGGNKNKKTLNDLRGRF